MVGYNVEILRERRKTLVKLPVCEKCLRKRVEGSVQAPDCRRGSPKIYSSLVLNSGQMRSRFL